VGSWLALPLLLALCGAHIWLFRGFVIDDTFISFRYVDQWVHGNGLVYNIGERVEGYSNFLWVVLLAPFALAGTDLLLAAKIVGAICSLLTVVLVWGVARRWPLSWIAPLLLVASGPFAAWSVGGLETPLFVLLLTAALALFLREEQQERGWLSGICFGLLALTRPEGGLFALVAVGVRGWRLAHQRNWPHRRDWARAAAVGAIVLPHLAWRLSYYGYPLPNTVYAKAMGLHPRALLEGGYYLVQCLTFTGGLWALALCFCLALCREQRSFAAGYLFTTIAAYTAVVTLGGGDWMPLYRFLVHILPAIWLLVHLGLVRLHTLLPPRHATLLVALLVIAQAAYLGTFSLEQRFLEHLGTGNAPTAHRPNLDYLQQHVKSGDTVAVIYAGFAYDLPRDVYVLDMVGLNDEHIAHLPPQFPGGLLGRGDVFGKWDVEYVLAHTPRYVQAGSIWPAGGGRWQTSFTGTTLLINDPRFQHAYRPVGEPGAEGLFVRVAE
jgi:arabinofuranosyltransferase